MIFLNQNTVDLPDGNHFVMSAVESTVLRTLMQQPGVVYSREVLNTKIYGANKARWPQSDVLTVIVGRIRKQFRAHGYHDVIYTVRDFGYCLNPKPRTKS